MKQHIETITDLLLGAAHADEEFVGYEVVTIRSILTRIHRTEILPPERVKQIKSFDPKSFDAIAAAKQLADLTPRAKRRIIELVAQVVDADHIVDLEEDAYLRRVAVAMGLSVEEFEDLTLDLDEDEDPLIELVE
jgi:uncharacterized tellurite resistance protein B-like protein